jgi:hypothetical protein
VAEHGVQSANQGVGVSIGLKKKLSLFSKFLNRIGVIPHIDIYPHQPRNAKNVNKIDNQKSNEQAECGSLAPPQHPMEQCHKKQAKPPRPDI